MGWATSQTNKAILLALMGYINFSACDAFRKTLSGDYSAVDVFFWVSAINLFILIILSEKLGGFTSAFKTKMLKMHFLRGLTGASASFFALKTFTILPMVEAYTIFFISPFIVTILSVFIYKETLSSFRIMALVGGFMGVLIAMRPGAEMLSDGTIYGIISAFSFSAFLLTAKPLRENNETNFSMLFYPVFFAMILSFILVDEIKIITDAEVWAILTMGAIPSLIGTFMLIKAFSMADASLLSTTHYSQLIWGFIIGMIVFAEHPDMFVLMGSMMVVASGIILISEKKLQQLMAQRQKIVAKEIAAE